jgi:hypothetical protein
MSSLEIFGFVAPFGLVALGFIGLWLVRRFA